MVEERGSPPGVRPARPETVHDRQVSSRGAGRRSHGRPPHTGATDPHAHRPARLAGRRGRARGARPSPGRPRARGEGGGRLLPPAGRAVHELPPHADPRSPSSRRARYDHVQLLDPVVRVGFRTPVRGRSPAAAGRPPGPTAMHDAPRGGRRRTGSIRCTLLVLGLLAAASMSSAFVNTLFTQTVNFAADDFGVSDRGVGIAGSVVRAGIILVLPVAALADRAGRRRVVTAMAVAAPLVSAAGAIAPTFPFLVATQAVGRPLGLALDFLIVVVAAEEMPRNSRAYAVSILAMASGLGAGLAVMALPLADLSSGSCWSTSSPWSARRRGGHRPTAPRDPPVRATPHHRPPARPRPVRRAGRRRPAHQPLRGPGQLVPERLPRGRPRLQRDDDRRLHDRHGDTGRDRADRRRPRRRCPRAQDPDRDHAPAGHRGSASCRTRSAGRRCGPRRSWPGRSVA